MQTQTIQKDNRAPGVRRVALETLVELCGQEPDMPAFEGRSINVSGRGMLVESDFLPPSKTALVMRFEHEGREVVVEGLVAWRDKSKAGGRFGVRFTALDSKSVIVLKQLCGQESADADEQDDAPPESKPNSPLFAELDDSHTPQPVITTTVGAPMKLHIAGLAAPMKARVVDGKSSRLRVGSQLDFLKLGRSLEVEDLSLGIKREANVHSVDVQVDAGSGIPQLVVTLRWNGSEDITPAPVVSSSKRRPPADEDYFTKDELTSPGKQAKRSVPPKPAARVSQDDDERSDDDYEDEDDEFNTAEALLKSRVALWATALSRGMRSASERVASASRGTGQLLQDLVKRPATERPQAKAKPGAVRSTRRLNKDTIPPGQSRGPRRSQFPQSNRPAASNAPAPSGVTLKRSHLVAGAATLCLGLGLYMFGANSKPESAETTVRELPTLAAGETARALPANPAAVPALPAEAVNPQTAALRRQPLDTEQQLRTDTHGMVANVPLFGPTQMATTEPAPDADEQPVAATPRRLGVDEVSLAKDESFSDKVVAEPVEQSSQRVFQVGRMNLPVIHRLRLDAPAELLQGEKTPNGFSVLVPGRKVMETGAGISSRDERITQVSAKNTPAGARVTFRFGKEIPGYKARLRNDYIEFFINSP